MFKNLGSSILMFCFFCSSANAGFVLKKEFQNKHLNLEEVHIFFKEKRLVVSSDIAQIFEYDGNDDDVISFGILKSIKFVRSAIKVDVISITAENCDFIGTGFEAKKTIFDVGVINVFGSLILDSENSFFSKRLVEVPILLVKLKPRVNILLVNALRNNDDKKIIELIDSGAKILPAFMEYVLNCLTYEQFGFARKWFKIAADKGDEEAQYELAVILKEGKGGDPDLVLARHYFQLSANLGNPKAQTNLAIQLQQGSGGDQNLELARYYYRLAADQDIPTAQYNLALMLIKGEGGRDDGEGGWEYLIKAADLGYSLARDCVKKTKSLSDLLK